MIYAMMLCAIDLCEIKKLKETKANDIDNHSMKIEDFLKFFNARVL